MSESKFHIRRRGCRRLAECLARPGRRRTLAVGVLATGFFCIGLVTAQANQTGSGTVAEPGGLAVPARDVELPKILGPAD
ncbi:MAG: hypothetical protein V1262_08150, partial [Alphaproteobacteria bacterium]|nr:hypothetical protein [Alphaproteobacteria bacterium]